jgi:hypothetical protein
LSYSFNESQLLLSWNPPVEPLFTPQGFQVYKKMNAGKFEQIAETQESFYTEAIADSGSYQYYIKTYYAEGESDVSNVVAFEYPHVSTSDSGITPYITKLYNAYPNPFNPSTMIKYSLSAPAKVKLSIYNLRGQKVKTLVEDMMPAGIHEVQWNGTDSSNRQTASGVTCSDWKHLLVHSPKKHLNEINPNHLTLKLRITHAELFCLVLLKSVDRLSGTIKLQIKSLTRRS